MSTTPNNTSSMVAAAQRHIGEILAASRAATGQKPDAGKAIVDLVIAVGTDAPMLDVAQAMDSVLDASIDAAGKTCPSSLRVTCLGIGAYFGTTRFSTSVSDYLAIQVSDPSDLQERPLPPGDMARAVIDLSKYFDWLPGASRAIFVAGDTSLETVSDETAKVTEAIAAAKAANVKVYTCASVASDGDSAAAASLLSGKDIAEYARLAKGTSGANYISTNGATDFPEMLRKVICDNASPATPADGGPNGDGDSDGCDKGSGTAPCCCCQCEQARLIVRAASLLSAVLHRVSESCYPPGKGRPH
jgi:hypothetical protein